MAQPQREWFDKDYYKVLGVSETATEAEIRRAYRKLAKEHHPDAHPGSEDRFKEISAAYDVLHDADKRKSYDEVRKMGPAAGAAGFGAPGGRGAQGAPGAPGFTFTGDDFGGMFGDLFSRLRPNQGQGPGGGRATGQAGPQ